MYLPSIHNNDKYCQTINDKPFGSLSNNDFRMKTKIKNNFRR